LHGAYGSRSEFSMKLLPYEGFRNTTLQLFLSKHGIEVILTAESKS